MSYSVFISRCLTSWKPTLYNLLAPCLVECVDFNKIVVSFLKGPCLEYLLQHKILDTLHTLGRADVGILPISSLPVRCSRFLFYFVILTRHFH